MDRNKILISLGITLVVVVICGAMVMLSGNMLEIIRAHLGM